MIFLAAEEKRGLVKEKAGVSLCYTNFLAACAPAQPAIESLVIFQLSYSRCMKLILFLWLLYRRCSGPHNLCMIRASWS